MSFAAERTSLGGGRDEWGTPPEVFERIARLWAPTYDAFASHQNTRCATYSTLEGTFRNGDLRAHVEAEPEQIDSLDGLSQDWDRRRVFLNPPYSRGVLAAALEKCVASRDSADVIVALIPANTDTAWWHDLVLPFATVHELRGRIQFIHPAGDCGSKLCSRDHKPGEPTPGSPGGSAIVVYRPSWLGGAA